MKKLLLITLLCLLSGKAYALDAACIGASNTADTTSNAYVPYPSGTTTAANSYCKKISDALGFDSVFNYANSGSHFDDRTIYNPDKPGVETQLGSAITDGKDIVFVACCTNDWLDVSATEESVMSTFRSNMDGLVSTASTNNIQLVILAEPLVNNGWYNERIRAGNKVLRDIAEDNDLPFIDVTTKQENDARVSEAGFTGWFLSDGLHFDNDGHQNFTDVVIASQFAQASGGGHTTVWRLQLLGCNKQPHEVKRRSFLTANFL